MSRRTSLLLAVVAWLAGLTHARAAWRMPVSTEDNSGVTIEVASPFDTAPPTGYLPLWVTIHNSSGAARTWNFVSDGDTAFGNNGRHGTTETMHVENGQTGRFPILLPLDGSNSGLYRSMHPFRVEGYGVRDVPTSAPAAASGRTGGSAVLGMSDDLAAPIWSALAKEYADRKQELLGTPVDLGLLGGDWRALAGLDVLWLSDAGFTSLDASRRAAVRDWVSQGGMLVLCAQAADPSLRAAAGLPETGERADLGLGRVVLLPWDGKELPLERVIDLHYPFDSRRVDFVTAAAEEWPMTHAVGGIEINAPLLIFFIVVFAIVIGPLNLFVFAKSAQRHRLFWTTPAISVGASLVLMAFIFLQDGFGGAGQRAMLCVLLPDQKKTVVVQEQVARTGVLLSRQFHASEDLALTPLTAGNRAARTYQQTGRDYSGDWFASRSVQAHRARGVVPSRAEIQLANADAARDGAPPILTSTVPAAIRKITYLDPSGRRWVGEDLRTGVRITLRAGNPGESDYAACTSDSMKAAIASLSKRPGYFVAVADDGPFFETLPSIRWKTQRAIFAGAVTAAR